MLMMLEAFLIYILLSYRENCKFDKEKTKLLKAVLPFCVVFHHFFKYNDTPFFTNDFSGAGVSFPIIGVCLSLIAAIPVATLLKKLAGVIK